MKTNGLPVLQRQLHHVGDLERVDLAGRAAQDGEVLAGQMDEPAVDGGRAGDDAVGGNFLAGHAEVDLAVLGEQADLLEAAGIDQGVDALAGGELALLLLLGQAVGAAALLELLSSSGGGPRSAPPSTSCIGCSSVPGYGSLSAAHSRLDGHLVGLVADPDLVGDGRS